MFAKTGKQQAVRVLAVVLGVLAIGSATNSYATQAPVGLGAAHNFVILAKTGVSVAGVTAVVGNIGISPAAASTVTGFGLIADATNIFSTSSLVTGKIYAANYAAPTPATMTATIGDMETAYTDAANRTTPDFTELYTGDLSGKTLVPGLYKWGTSVQINGGVTLTGGGDDVWILQIAQNLTVGNDAMVTLSGGAQAKNIFWQVAGQATLGTTANFKGIILCKTLIVMQTGSSLYGRALAQTAVTLAAATVTAPDTAAGPTRVSPVPAEATRAGQVNIGITISRDGKTIWCDSRALLSSTANLYDVHGNGQSLTKLSTGVQGWAFSRAVNPGVYLLQFEAAGQPFLKKVMLLP